jgi:hypothetical protein
MIVTINVDVKCSVLIYRMKLWPNALGTRTDGNFCCLVSSANSRPHRLMCIFCGARKIPWCEVGIDHLAVCTLASPAFKRSSQHSVPHIKIPLTTDVIHHFRVCVTHRYSVTLHSLNTYLLVPLYPWWNVVGTLQHSSWASRKKYGECRAKTVYLLRSNLLLK